MSRDKMEPATMVEELVDLGNLTRWEAGFVVGLSNKLDFGEDLTKGELEKLEEIYHERCK